jgi:hypothetical protein
MSDPLTPEEMRAAHWAEAESALPEGYWLYLAVGVVIDRWYQLGMLRFSSRDDGGDDLILRDELVREALATLDAARSTDEGLREARGLLQRIRAFGERMPWVVDDQVIVLRYAREALATLDAVLASKEPA